MTTWFTSDQHYGHRNIIVYSKRPFRDVDVDDMREELIRRFNERVRPGDTVFHVGDFSLDDRKVAPVLARLEPGAKHVLIAGNHDRCHRCHHGHARETRKYLEYGFAQIHQTMTLEVGGETVNVEHMPYTGDSKHELRYAEYRPKDEGRWLFHGHVHEAWSERGKMINVGVDARNYAPISLEEVLEIMKRGPFPDVMDS